MKQWSDKAEGDKWYKWFICNRSAETTMTLWPKAHFSQKSAAQKEFCLTVPSGGDTSLLPGVSPWVLLPPHIWLSEPPPCLSLLQNYKHSSAIQLLQVPLYDSRLCCLSLQWFGFCSLRLWPGAKSLWAADVFASVHERAGGRRTAGRPLPKKKSGKEPQTKRKGENFTNSTFTNPERV